MSDTLEAQLRRLGWSVSAVRPSSNALGHWIVTVERADGSASITESGADLDAIAASLVHLARADAERRRR